MELATFSSDIFDIHAEPDLSYDPDWITHNLLQFFACTEASVHCFWVLHCARIFLWHLLGIQNGSDASQALKLPQLWIQDRIEIHQDGAHIPPISLLPLLPAPQLHYDIRDNPDMEQQRLPRVLQRAATDGRLHTAVRHLPRQPVGPRHHARAIDTIQ